MISILLLGTPQVLRDQAPLPLVRRKTRALLYFIAAQPEPQPRERLLALFWPDAPRASAQQVLRTTLHGLRKDLGGAFVAGEETLALSPETWVDARAFEAALARPAGDLAGFQAALELYRGEFLDGFSLPDGPEFESWMTVERERFRRLALRGWAGLSRAYAARQDYPRALETLERALAFDFLQEDLQREAMRLQYLTGDRPGAIRRYDQLRRALDEEMGVPPMSETRQVYDSIIKDEVRRPATLEGASTPVETARPVQPMLVVQVDSPIPFTGREAELKAIREATAAHRLVMIEGEPGIGKTRLAAEFLSRDAHTGGIALAGAARELEQALPYQPVIEALRGLASRPDWGSFSSYLRSAVPSFWLSEAVALVPELDPTGQPGRASIEESRLWDAVYRILAALAGQQPVTLFLDDLQWADASTLGMLSYLARQSSQSGTVDIRFLAATRPIPPRTPVATLVQSMTRENRITRIALTRLGKPEIVEIARRLSPQYTYPLANWLENASEGNPYVLAELVRHARENGLLLADGEVNLNALSASTIVPQSVYSLIQSRLDRLSEGARRILEAAVASGRAFEFDVAARAAGISETAALDALSELGAAGLIHPGEGTQFIFDHSLIMEVASREVGEARCRLLHRRVAEAMESLYRGSRLEQEAGMIAWHYREGRAPERAAPFALLAARQAVRLAAWTEAAAFYEQAAESESSADRYQALIGLGKARMQGGQAVQAADAFRQALALVQTEPRAGSWEEASLELAGSYLTQARFDEILPIVRRVREAGRPEYSQQAEFVWGAALSVEGSDLDGATMHLEAAASLCRQSPPRDPALESRVQFELGSVAAQQGDLPRAIALYQQALDLACRSEDEATLNWCALAHNNLAYHLLLMGDLTAAQQHARDGMALANEKGMLTQLTYLYSTSGEIALAKGDLEGAEQDFMQGLELAGRFAMAERVAGLTANLGLVSLRRGDTALAIHRLSTALARAEAAGTHHLAAQIRIWLAPLLPPDEARAALAEARAFAERGPRRLLLDQVAEAEKQIQAAQ
jgi:DNA-binding SARP family transcriptional activator